MTKEGIATLRLLLINKFDEMNNVRDQRQRENDAEEERYCDGFLDGLDISLKRLNEPEEGRKRG